LQQNKEEGRMARPKDKLAIITGAARGQGAETARLFLEEGAADVLTDMRSESAPALMGTFSE
jgi:3alpha(or 20beta)-hydroxysteroid dehydrogenase